MHAYTHILSDCAQILGVYTKIRRVLHGEILEALSSLFISKVLSSNIYIQNTKLGGNEGAGEA